jgi:hypothetical protein
VKKFKVQICLFLLQFLAKNEAEVGRKRGLKGASLF